MAPRPVGYGRPGTPVIPAGWESDHAPVIEGTFDCTVRIGHPGGQPTWNRELKRTVTPGAGAAYDGPASVSAASADGRRDDVVDEQVDEQTFIVQIPRTATVPADDTDDDPDAERAPTLVHPDMVIDVIASPDPHLSGARLQVTGVDTGREFTRVITATLAR